MAVVVVSAVRRSAGLPGEVLRGSGGGSAGDGRCPGPSLGRALEAREDIEGRRWAHHGRTFVRTFDVLQQRDVVNGFELDDDWVGRFTLTLTPEPGGGSEDDVAP